MTLGGLKKFDAVTFGMILTSELRSVDLHCVWTRTRTMGTSAAANVSFADPSDS